VRHFEQNCVGKGAGDGAVSAMRGSPGGGKEKGGLRAEQVEVQTVEKDTEDREKCS